MTETAAPATPAAPVAAPKTWYDGVDAKVVESWTNKGYDLSNPKETAAKMWEQYAHLESHLGVPADRLIRLPKDASDTAAWQSVYQKLGAPKDAKEYNFGEVKFSDGSELDDRFAEAMRSSLYKANVTKDAASEIVKSVVKALDDSEAADKAIAISTLEEQKATLLREWGQSAEMNLLTAKQGAKRLGVDPATVAALEEVIGYHKIMEMFRKIGAGTSEDTFIGPAVTNAVTVGNAKARLEQLLKDQAWTKALMSGDGAAMREHKALQEQITGVVDI